MVIAGMALLSSISIGAVFLATEASRVDVRRDGQAMADLYDQAVRLSNVIHNQEAGVDDYLLSRTPGAKTRYEDAVHLETQVEERMRQIATGLIEYPGVTDALDA